MQKIIIGIIAVAVLAALGWYGYTRMNTQDATDTSTQQPAAEALVAANATPAGEVREIMPGLTAQDFVVGDGREAASSMYAAVLYEGRLADGTVFDSTASRQNQPFVFQVGAGQVIKGWDLGVAGMKVGGVRRLVVAPELAYGNQVVGPIPAGSTLTFDVKLLATEDAAVVEQQIKAEQEAQKAQEGGPAAQ
jgi:FKBP-type peptidyl-prolyl cis-trans isomerase